MTQSASPTSFETCRLPAEPDAVAPDGSRVRVLLRRAGGSMAHFELPAGRTSRAVVHPALEEIWFFVDGRGEMWRHDGTTEQIVAVEPGTCVTIPAGTRFQFRAAADVPLAAVGVTMPPWPGDDAAVPVSGPWRPGDR